MDQLQPFIEEIGCWAEQAFAKKNMTKIFINTAIVLAMSALTQQALACASCGCSLNSDWGTQGVSNQEGFSLDVRFDTLNQNQLWSGKGKISSAAAAQTTNTQTQSNAEVENFTQSHTLNATLDYSSGESWGVSVVLPVIQRSHETFGASDLGVVDAANGYASRTTGVGDVRVLGRYFGFTEQKNVGVQFGLKLPTGRTNQMSSDGATAVDPGLQLGTGTTDMVLGVYAHDNLNQDWGYFTQALYQRALNSSTMAAGDFRPGNSLNLNAGVRFEGYESLKPTLQVNARVVQRDSGSAADTYATGGTLVYVTPGLIAPITDKLAVYSNLQIPVYQNVNGIQLTPRYIFSLGAHLNF